MPKQRWGRIMVEGTTEHAVRNIDKRYLTEGLSRTEKDNSGKPADFSRLLAKVGAVIEKADYLNLIESDSKHLFKILDVRDPKSVNGKVMMTVELESLKKRGEETKVKRSSFILFCDPKTAQVSSDYKGEHTSLIEGFIKAVSHSLKK